MNKIILKIPRNKQKVKIIKSEDIIRREFERKLLELESLVKSKPIEVEELPEVEEFIGEPEPEPQPKVTYFTETYTISDSNEPIEIDLRRVPDESIPIEEAAKEIQSAYDKGFSDGQDSARAIYQSEIQIHSQWIKRFDKIAFELKKAFLQEQKKFNEALIDLSIEIARKIMGFAAVESEQLVISQINKVFSEIKDEEIFKIELNKDDFEVLKKVNSQIFNLADSKIEIVTSNNIEQGSCILHTSAGIIDGRISEQLKKLQNALTEAKEQIKLDLESSLKESYPDILDTIMPETQEIQENSETNNSEDETNVPSN
ncbi:MAG: FliH/SctL family protein [Ignavibacteria bacterium]|nr:FliH/SctL family protein [Ignavibacteria bacterium]